MYVHYSLQDTFPPPPVTISESDTTCSSATPGTIPTTGVSLTSNNSHPDMRSTSYSVSKSFFTSFRPTTFSTAKKFSSLNLASIYSNSNKTNTLGGKSVSCGGASTLCSHLPEPGSSILTDLDGGYLSGVLPKLTNTAWVGSTLVNCQWIFRTTTPCPTTTEALPESCTEPTTTVGSTTPKRDSASTPLPTPTILVRLEFSHLEHKTIVTSNIWTVFLGKPGITIDVCGSSQAQVFQDDRIKQTDKVNSKNVP